MKRGFCKVQEEGIEAGGGWRMLIQGEGWKKEGRKKLNRGASKRGKVRMRWHPP